MLALLEGSLAAADAARIAAEAERAARERELHAVREREHGLTMEQSQLTDSVHRDEVARAEQRMRIDVAAAARGRRAGPGARRPGRGVRPAPAGAAQPWPPPPTAPHGAGDPEPAEPLLPMPYDRAKQEKRLRAAERALALLGTVNPLALEEFAALEERHTFLVRQLEDLKASRRDLLDIVREVDERVEQVFTEAFADTAREFEGVFSRLFPGGEGRLVLTDPSNMLDDRARRRGAPAGQEGQAAVAALGRRAVADRRGDAGRDLQGAAEPVLRHGRGRGRARRHQPAAG